MNWMKSSMLLLCLVTMTMGTQAAEIKKDFTKEISKTFPVREGALLHVENKYGHVNVTSWDKNEIQIDVKIMVKTSSESKAEEIFDLISVEMKGDASEVSAITEFDNDNNNTSWWQKMWGDGEPEGKYEISYDIKAPSRTRLDLENKYGQLSVQSDFVGKAHLINKYGNVYTANIDGAVTLDLGYGNATLGDIGDLVLDVKYSKVEIGSAGDVDSNTKYSQIKTGQVGAVLSSSKYDEYSIVSAESFKNEGKYDHFKIGKCGKLQVETKYGSVAVEQIHGDVSLEGNYSTLHLGSVDSAIGRIAIEGKYSNATMYTDHKFSLHFVGERVTPHLPEGFQNVEYHKDGHDLSIKGHMGGPGGTKISAEMEYGSFKIKSGQD